MQTIVHLQLTNKPQHPAVGRVFEITLSNHTKHFVYEETFFNQFTACLRANDWKKLVGKEIDTNEDFYTL